MKPGSAIGHTARYLADKVRARLAAKEKRKAEGLPEDEEHDQPQHIYKRVNRADSGVSLQQIEDLKIKALRTWNEQMQTGTDMIYKRLYGQHWEEGKKYELEKLARKQAEHQQQLADREAGRLLRLTRTAVSANKVYKDDYDPRY